jgi:hypothetical protein
MLSDNESSINSFRIILGLYEIGGVTEEALKGWNCGTNHD